MSSARWQRAKQLFQQASAMAADQRLAFLQAHCEDASLRQEVEALLTAHGSAESFLEQPAFIEAAEVVSQQHEAQMIGRRFGVWRVQRFLDRGGMGAVYLAERATGGFSQLAALKLLRPGLDHAGVIRRFEQERQILANLDHPNIAKLLDGGNSDDGQPWLAMEYIKGVPVDHWCEDQRLTTAGRAGLLRRVAEAVQFAHQHLVVHRDLKPSNILVTANGEPKLLDFGVAKLLRIDADCTQPTATMAPMLTPDYASPEQIRGEPVTSASDVYALGVLLFRLLTGVQPYHISSTSPGELLAKICEQEPVKPSASLRNITHNDPAQAQRIAAAQQTRPKRLLRTLQGDLDTITMTALRKEPARRYATPGLLAADLSRWENALPVNARPDSVGYRSAKFVRRHKVGLAAAAAVLIAMFAGLGAALWQAERATAAQLRAEARFNDTHQLANALVFDLHDAIANLPGSTKARQLLVDRALVYLEKLRANAAGDPLLLADLAAAYVKIGDVQGHPENSSLGDLAAATLSYDKALVMRRTLAERDPSSAAAQQDLAVALDRVGMALWWRGDDAAALERHRLALAVRHTAIKLAPDDPTYARGLADTHESIGKILTWHSKLDEALAHFDQSLALREAQWKLAPGDPDRTSELASVLIRKGYARSWQDPTQSQPLYQRAIRLLTAAIAVHPQHLPLRLTLARARSRMAESYLDLKQYEPSIAEHKKALQILENVVGQDPHDARARAMLALGHAKISDTYLAQGAADRAEEHARHSLEVNQQLAADDPDNSGMLEDVASSQQRLGRVFEAQSHYPEARAYYEQSLALRLDLLQRPQAVAHDRRNVASILLDLGDVEFAYAKSQPAGSQRSAAMRVSRQRYQESLDQWQRLIDTGKLYPQDQQTVDSLRAKVTEMSDSLE